MIANTRTEIQGMDITSVILDRFCLLSIRIGKCFPGISHAEALAFGFSHSSLLQPTQLPTDLTAAVIVAWPFTQTITILRSGSLRLGIGQVVLRGFQCQIVSQLKQSRGFQGVLELSHQSGHFVQTLLNQAVLLAPLSTAVTGIPPLLFHPRLKHVQQGERVSLSTQEPAKYAAVCHSPCLVPERGLDRQPSSQHEAQIHRT
jgi:hypothetical protein